MVESFVKQGTVMEYLVKFEKAVIQVEKSLLKLKKRKIYENFRYWERNSRCYL